MTSRIDAQLLRRIRNDISVRDLIRGRLEMTWKESEGVFRFLCPLCGDFHTATNPRTNLARCFRCRRNFNTIDLTMIVQGCTFLEAVDILRHGLD